MNILQLTTRLLILIFIDATIALDLSLPPDLEIPLEQIQTQTPYCFLAPPTCPTQNVRFFLYTSSSPAEYVELDVANPDSIKNATFVKGPIKIIFHGYTGDQDYTPNSQVRPAYLASGVVNVISVDYGPLVRQGCYIFAAQNTNVAAKCSAQLIDYLLQLRPEFKLSDIHLIGLSLGAQTCGQIADYLKAGKIELIVSLEAAQPLFYRGITPPTRQIHKGDAKQIIALHTNSGLAGQDLPYGNVDFFANGGSFQPGCAFLDLKCDHERSAYLFARTILSPHAYPSYKCSQPPSLVLGKCIGASGPIVDYGEYVNPNITGVYAFNTAGTPPYNSLPN